MPDPAGEGRKSSFAPVVDVRTRLLILGSLPGEVSLAEQRYYAHPRNRFWHLVGQAIGCDLTALPYNERLTTLLAHHVGLWDTIASAERRGSLDAAIRNEAHNPLADLAATLPALRAVAFNGAKAAKVGRRLLATSPLTLIDLPSSSPAHAAMPLARKEELWRHVGDFVR
ncbi:DNA-deoxyinosine glycosylase [Altererythrobacter sp. KTW20L]|uniref:DNA-deoxyinosine glycosylase n=1 Tax=Altererythrobacter sp. KTW20L TaxID=2942210 RepID=UPI0020BDD642|nr:DNA-deoxyinosine glycosylase [Altererythrobacter sp. KTW20L]MCL6252203.1 DNA-deoxyinosine glycosylase [Altererythrobacter sp. KTW20L]